MARILVADDDESVRATVRHVLVAAGHTVDEAADGQTALDRYRDTPSDLVLIDLYMPRMDGLETILRLKAVQPDVKIVAMSGGGFRDKHDVLTMARRAGACLTLAKPFAFEDLLAAVSHALGPAAVGPEVDAGQIAEVKGLPGGPGTEASPKATVLLVDDDERARWVLRSRLRSAGYAVVEAPDAERALEVFRAEPTDVVITDLILPGKSGADLISDLGSAAPTVGIVAISGAPERLAALSDALAGRAGFRTLPKPFTTEQLLNAIAAVVSKDQAPRQPSSRLWHVLKFLRRKRRR